MPRNDPNPGMMPQGVDLRTLKQGTALCPLDQLALRRHMEAERKGDLVPPGAGDGFGATGETIIVALYARYSTTKQKEKSIERQIKVATAYMRARGFHVYVLYADPGKSGRSMRNRKRLQDLLRDCREGRIKIILVEDFDRWSRETYDAVQVCEELNDLGVQFHSAADFKALNKREVIQAAVKAEADKDRRTLIMGMGRLQHASQGGAHSGEFFGYRYGKEPGFLVQHPGEAETIQTVFEMAAAGMSYRSIGRAMKELGVAGPTENCKWTFSTVGNILGQIAYTGRVYYPLTLNVFDRKTEKTKTSRRHPSEITMNQFENLRIVSDDLFFTVNARRKPRKASKFEHAHFLTGKVTCGCAGIENQKFTMKGEQLTCSVWSDGEGCAGNPHSVTLDPVERAVLTAVCDRLRSLVGEEEFATVLARKLREATAARRAARAAVEAAIAEIVAQLGRMLRTEIQNEYPPEIQASERVSLQRELAAKRSELDSLAELPVVEDAEGQLRTLSATLDHLVERVPFRAATPAEAKVSAALGRLVRRVVVMRDGCCPGTMRLAVHLDFVGFLHEDGASTTGDGPDVIHVDVEQPLGTRNRLRGMADQIVATGAHRLDDARWNLVADRLPDVTSHRPDSRHITTREVVDALVLRLMTGLPVITRVLADGQAMDRALMRFVNAAGDRILVDLLQEVDPRLLATLDLRPLEMARKRWRVGGDDWRGRRGTAARLHALDGKAALTDEQWERSRPLLHPCVEVSMKGTVGLPGRQLLEAVILGLRTGLGWLRMPERFGDGNLLEGSVRRLVRSGSWDRLLELWTREFPALVDGLDIGRLAGMSRGSEQWRGPSPRRSRYAGKARVAPAKPRPRRTVRRERRAPKAA